MIRDILYIIFGYLCGGILFAKLFAALLGKGDITENTEDKNPGTANAFKNGGFWCGTLTLCFDLLKGFLPVLLYLKGTPTNALALVVAAPVIGHAFPLFFRFSGGKGIATAFGCFLGLLPNYIPLAFLALAFVFFSVVIRISPHYYRTIVTYSCVEIALLLFPDNFIIFIGFTFICVAFGIRMFTSEEEKKPIEVGLLWMH